MKCPTCGAENDSANRFCDQCGTRLDAPAAVSPAQATMAAQPTAAAPVCATCGSTVLPGQAFCDECGAPLSSAAPAASSAPSGSEAPTVLASGPPSAPAPAASGAGVICPQCGRDNLPGDRFCDNCGAALTGSAPAATQQAAAEIATVVPDAPPSIPDAATAAASEPAQPAPLPSEIPTVVPDEAPPAAPAPEPEAAPPPAEPEAAAPPAEPAPESAPTPAAPDAQAAFETQRRELEEAIGRQQTVVSQLEAVQAALGVATPAGVLQSLDDARAALSRAQAELDSLQPPAPPVDPAEVARITDEIARQQSVVSQLEAVQAALGAATPAGVLQSLDDARAAVARTQAELDALTGGAPAAPAAVASPAPVAAPAPTPATEETVVSPAAAPAAAAPAGPTDQTVLAPPVSAPPPPPPPPAPAGARLVFEDGGQEITLPTDRREIIIGREDPISGIHPEVDMTPFGGESGGVSRQHARMNLADGRWTITDLNSTNYTRVDGVKLEPNTPTPLQDGARVQLGRVTLTFRA